MGAEDDRVEGSARFQHRPEAHSIASPDSSPKSGRTDLGNSSCWSFGNLEESPRAQPQVVESHLADLRSWEFELLEFWQLGRVAKGATSGRRVSSGRSGKCKLRMAPQVDATCFQSNAVEH